MVIVIENVGEIVGISPTLTNGFEFKPLGIQLCFVVELYHPNGPSQLI